VWIAQCRARLRIFLIDASECDGIVFRENPSLASHLNGETRLMPER
jgi:hypothetical protein